MSDKRHSDKRHFSLNTYPRPKSDFFDADDEPAIEVIPGILRQGQIAILAGAFGVGKSPLILDLAVRVTLGLEWGDEDVKQRPVILFDFESTRAQIIRGVRNVCKRLHEPLPAVPDEFEPILSHDLPPQPGGVKYSRPTAPTEWLASALKRKPDALVVIDPIELMFQFDKLKGKDILDLYAGLRDLLRKFPEASILSTFNLRKRDRKTRKANLLLESRDWLDEISGSADIVNRCDVRLGFDFGDGDGEENDLRILNGVRRGELMNPILLRPIGDSPEEMAGFERVPPEEIELRRALTTRQLEYWRILPRRFRFGKVASRVVPKSSLHRLIQKAISLGLLKRDKTTYCKVCS